MPGTRTSVRSRGRCACSRRGGPPRRRPPRPAPRSIRNRPLRGPARQTPDPLACLLARELADRLPDHLLEPAYPIVDHIRDEGLEVVELLPGRGQLAPSFLVLGLGTPVALRALLRRLLHDLFLAAKLLECGDAHIDRVAKRPRLGPGLGHPDQVRGDGPVDVLRGGVPDAGELAFLRPD